MDETPHENGKQPDGSVEQKVLDAIHHEVESDIQPENDAPRSHRKTINYTNNQIKEALGTIFLGVLSVFLLLALLRALKRERKLRDGLLRKV